MKTYGEVDVKSRVVAGDEWSASRTGRFIYFNIILTSKLRSSKIFLTLHFFLPKLCMHFQTVSCMLHATNFLIIMSQTRQILTHVVTDGETTHVTTLGVHNLSF
jgi:hypothetical protein